MKCGGVCEVWGGYYYASQSFHYSYAPVKVRFTRSVVTLVRTCYGQPCVQSVHNKTFATLKGWRMLERIEHAGEN